jgi:hypothetical protein
VKRRSAKFLGSAAWRSRDVSRYVTTLQGDPAVTFTDVQSGISTTVRLTYGEDRALRELAHRVHQFE